MNIHSHPKKLPIEVDLGKIAIELANAQYALGLLEGSQKKLLNPRLLIAPLTTVEAEVSSKIEGTQSSAKDILIYEAGGKPTYTDTPQVSNYKQAMNYAIDELNNNRPIDNHLIRSLHKNLLENCRYEGELGNFRNKTVYIAEKRTDPIEKALYIPPEHLLVPDYMENLISFFKDNKVNVLVQAGIIHYQFEAIHPFEDGNGRIGRLLIPLVLYHKKKVSLPIIYVSGYMESHRDQYREALHSADTEGKYEKWLNFFLRAISEQATQTGNIIDKIYKLYDRVKQSFEGTKSPYLHPAIDFIFEKPIFTIKSMMANIKTNRKTCVRQIENLVEKHYIAEVPQYMRKDKREKLYVFLPLINLL